MRIPVLRNLALALLEIQKAAQTLKMKRPHPYQHRDYSGGAPLFFRAFRARRTLWQILTQLFNL